MGTIVRLYSNIQGEIDKFLQEFYGSSFAKEADLEWEKIFDNPIEIVDIIGAFVENSDIYKISIDYNPNEDVKKDFISEYGNAIFRKEKYIDEIIKEKIFKNNFVGTAKIYSYICYDDNDNIKYAFSPRGGKLYLCKVKSDKEEIEIYKINERKK